MAQLSDESFPLLPRSTSTPLPKAQLFTLCLIRLVEPIAFAQVFPYINEMIADLHLPGGPSRIAFYSGLAESAFAISSLFSIYHWARLSGQSFSLFILSQFIFFLRRNWSSSRHFHWHAWHEPGHSSFWSTTVPCWTFTCPMPRSVTVPFLNHTNYIPVVPFQEAFSQATWPLSIQSLESSQIPQTKPSPFLSSVLLGQLVLS